MSFTAQGMADAITEAQGPAQDPSIQAEANLKMATGIVAYIQSSLQFVIPAESIATVGGPAAQSGPASPVLLSAAP